MKNKIDKDRIKEIIKETLTQKFHQLQNISPEKQKIIGVAATVPIIAAGTMSGACAATCPYGLVNDPYPGQCGRYMDANGDGICDFSQTTTSTTTDSSSQDTSTQDTTSADTSTQTTTDVDSTGTDTPNGLQEMGGNANGVDDSGSNIDSANGLDGLSADDGTNYHIFPVTLILLGSYFFTYYLFKKGILKPQQHKRLWNLLVTAGYLGTGITGVLLTVMINMGIYTAYNQGLTYWHAELAILMVVGTLLHVHIYWKPFKKMFKVLFGFKTNKEPKVKVSEEGLNRIYSK